MQSLCNWSFPAHRAQAVPLPDFRYEPRISFRFSREFVFISKCSIGMINGLNSIAKTSLETFYKFSSRIKLQPYNFTVAPLGICIEDVFEYDFK